MLNKIREPSPIAIEEKQAGNIINIYRSRPQVIVMTIIVLWIIVFSAYIIDSFIKYGSTDSGIYWRATGIYLIFIAIISPFIILQIPGYYIITLTSKALVVKKGFISHYISIEEILSVNCIARGRRFSGIRIDYNAGTNKHVFVPNWLSTRMDLISKQIKLEMLNAGNYSNYIPNVGPSARIVGDVPPGKYESLALAVLMIPFVFIIVILAVIKEFHAR